MFREMRRKKQMLSYEKCLEILKESSSGVLAVFGDNGYPYAVPLSYVFIDGKIYFHSALDGHKSDAIRAHDKVSFCIIAQDQIVPKKYTTYYKSVIAFGTIRILKSEQEKREAIEQLALKYAPNDSVENRTAEIERSWNAFDLLEMTIEHLSGKQAKELAVSDEGSERSCAL